MRRALVLVSSLALTLVLAGCGGSESTKPQRAPEPDPAATLRALIAAPPVPTGLLTPSSRRVPESDLSEGVGSFPDDAHVESRGAGPGWAVAWTSADRVAEGQKEFAAYAVALKRKGPRWLAEIAGPVTLRPLGPEPGSAVGPIPQVAVEAKAPHAIEDAALWIDGQPVDFKSGGPSTRYISVYGAPAAPLEPGHHVAIAFARAGESASAVAWPFTVR